MIGRLRGEITTKQAPIVMLDVNGVGYEIECTLQTFALLPELQQTVIIYTHLVVREDAHALFGFHEIIERDLFRLLIKISGVGPKLGLAILSYINPEQLIQCVNMNDLALLQTVPGVGKKLAQRLMIDIRDRLKNWDTNTIVIGKAGSPTSNSQPAVHQDAISALIALGYKLPEARAAVTKVSSEHNHSEAIIREALQYLAAAVE